MDQMLLCLLDRFRNGDRDLGCLPFSNPHPSLSVTDHDQSTEVEPLPAFDDFRDPVDEHHFILEVQLIWIDSHAIPLLSLYDQLFGPSQTLIASHRLLARTSIPLHVMPRQGPLSDRDRVDRLGQTRLL